jgi:hypothetical protein
MRTLAVIIDLRTRWSSASIARHGASIFGDVAFHARAQVLVPGVVEAVWTTYLNHADISRVGVHHREIRALTSEVV